MTISPKPSRPDLPFAGLRILDISQGISGPYCTHILWQQGAQVIKVEPPAGDWARGVGVIRGDMSSLAIAFNGGKQGLCVDATTPAGRDILRGLAEQVDIIIENFRPGVAVRLGLDPLALRAQQPRLIYVSISGYGDEGPYAGAPATDSVVQADAGLMFANRDAQARPRKIGVYLADVNSGLYAAQAVSAALYRQARDGQGAHLELNLFDTCAATMVCNFTEHAMEPQREQVPVIPVSAPNGSFAASDGAINIVTINDDQFRRVCAALGHLEWPEDPRFADQDHRIDHVQELNRLIGDVLADRPVAYWCSQLKAHDVLHAPVRTFSQCVDHPQAVHMNTFESLHQPGIGTLAWPGTPVRSLRRPIEAAPHIGEHTLAILGRAGFPASQIELWVKQGVIKQAQAGA